MPPLLNGGEDLGRKYVSNIGGVSILFVFSELGFYGNTGMLVCSTRRLQICGGLSRLSRKNLYYGGSLGLRPKGLAAFGPGKVSRTSVG